MMLKDTIWKNQINVTFQFDMAQQTEFITPEINGNFNSWCRSAQPNY